MEDLKQTSRAIFALIDQMQSGKAPWSRFDDIVSPDFKAFVGSETLDANGFKNTMQTFAAAFSDGSHTILDMVSEADTVMLREVWRGRHTSAFLEAPPTGKVVESTVMVMLKFRDGKVREFHEIFDTLSFMKMTGVLKT